jgi:hypothetical protein
VDHGQLPKSTFESESLPPERKLLLIRSRMSLRALARELVKSHQSITGVIRGTIVSAPLWAAIHRKLDEILSDQAKGGR